jgi:hypothetical protein
MLSRLYPSELLMQWREPNAYVRKDLSHGRWIGLLVVLNIPALLFLWSASNNGFTRRREFGIFSFALLGAVIFVVTWFGPGPAVCLTEDHIAKRAGRSAKRTSYQNIVRCSIRHDAYNGSKFAVLSFDVIRGLPLGQVTEVAVPDDATLDRILHVLQDKGVRLIEEKTTATS